MDSIVLDNISKSYKLYQNKKDPIKELFLRKKLHQKFQALKNIKINIKKGTTLGIVGRNGSGKSTLLKIIAGITEPDNGSIDVTGNVSFLNIAVGLDNEMTGIENIYLKGTLMGFTKKEIDRRLNDIIEFSELDIYINQPIKTYSSGMRSKLGFAIAVNVDPDILIIDEALAVGDAKFQKKCKKKLQEFKKSDKTILYVSHNHKSVKDFCEEVVWIEKGEITTSGPSQQVIKLYEDFLNNKIKIEDVKRFT